MKDEREEKMKDEREENRRSRDPEKINMKKKRGEKKCL